MKRKCRTNTLRVKGPKPARREVIGEAGHVLNVVEHKDSVMTIRSQSDFLTPLSSNPAQSLISGSIPIPGSMVSWVGRRGLLVVNRAMTTSLSIKSHGCTVASKSTTVPSGNAHTYLVCRDMTQLYVRRAVTISPGKFV